MNEIKSILFRAVEQYHQEYYDCKKTMPPFELRLKLAKERFYTCFELILDCELEDEYLAWKTSKKKEASVKSYRKEGSE